MTPSQEVAALVARMPELDKPDPDRKRGDRDAGKLTGPPWAEAEPIYDQVLARGRIGVLAVIDMLKEVDDGTDYKARYVLHALGVYTARPGKEKQKAAVVEAIASQVGGGRPKPIQQFLIRQLQVCADKGVAGVLGGCLADAELFEPAAQALLAIDPAAAAEQFRAALPKAAGKCRLTLIQDLGVVGDAASASALRRAVGDGDRDVRVAAAWGLANMGDAGSVDVLLKAADAEEGSWERIEAAKACLVLAEKLAAAGDAARSARIYKRLRDTRTDASERYVREAAERALAG